MMPSHADHASDAMTLLEVIRALEADGYTGQFGVADGGGVHCFSCRAISPAETVQVERLSRTEGASDPADMVAVAAVRCPQCGVRGTLALKYGPGASPEEADILSHLDDRDRRQPMSPVSGSD